MKRLFVVAAILAAVIPVSAQKLAFGVKGGVDVAKMSFSSDAFKSDNRMGWYVGPTLKIGLPLGLGADISALYNQRESKIDLYYAPESGTASSTQAETLKTKQIIVPLNVRYGFGLGEMANIFVFAGPQVAFRVGDEVQNLTDFKNEAAEWRLNSSNFSVNAGIGLTLDHVQLTANYNVGVGKTGEVTWRTATDAVVNGYKGRYNSWQLSLAYFF